jgi:hypothetical protein
MAEVPWLECSQWIYEMLQGNVPLLHCNVCLSSVYSMAPYGGPWLPSR